jgi:hypothetical protein
MAGRVTEIKTLEQWNALAAELHAAGYTVFQTQYAADQPEGYHVWLWLSGRPQVHVVTHDRKVQEAIRNY